MTDAASRQIDGLREQCSGLSPEDVRQIERAKHLIRAVKGEGGKGGEVTLLADGAIHVCFDFEGYSGEQA